MTTFQKAIIATVITGAVAAGVYQTRQVSHLRQQVQTLEQQQQQQAAARQASVQAAAARQREYDQRTQAEADRRAAEEDRRAAQRERREAERARREAERARRRPPVSVPTPAPSSVPPSTYVAPLTPPATPRLYVASRPAETQVLPPTSQPVDAPVAPGGSPAPKTPDVVAVTYELQIEGVSAGSFGKLEDAVTAALAATTPGDRFEVLFNGKTTGLHVRTTSGSVDVPASLDSQVRLLSRDKMGQFVADAEAKTAASGGSLAWWLIPIAGAAVVAAKVF
jgi:hypothetical protein